MLFRSLAGDGLVKLLVAQCTHRFEIRALARPQEGPIESAAFRELVGDGRLTVTIEAEERAARYQGIVEVRGDTLAQCLESYFATSEQLQTRIAIATDTSRAAGLLLQKLPTAQSLGEATAAVSHDAWEDLESRAAKLDATLLRLGTPEEVLTSVCGEHDCRMFSATPVHFVCRCSPERVTDLLRALGADELRSVLAEQGAVTVTCEYCGRPYRFDAIDVERLFAEGASPDAPRSLN